jgi:hypothetical protein
MQIQNTSCVITALRRRVRVVDVFNLQDTQLFPSMQASRLVPPVKVAFGLIGVPQIAHATALGAAIHGAVAAGVVADYAEGPRRWSAKELLPYRPRSEAIGPYQALYQQYCKLSQNAVMRSSMHELNALGTPVRQFLAL